MKDLLENGLVICTFTLVLSLFLPLIWAIMVVFAAVAVAVTLAVCCVILIQAFGEGFKNTFKRKKELLP